MKKELLSIILMVLAITFPTLSWAQNNIQFEDEAVKAICVSNWDTNGDGELSYEEAAAVTNLGSVFRENKNITSFLELEYFTSLTEIPQNAFYQCSNLKEIRLPENVTTIGSNAFTNDYNLAFIELPEGVTTIKRGAFYICSKLSSIYIPKNVRSIESNVFGHCTGLESIMVDEENAVYDSRNRCNAIINTSTNTLITGCKATVIPDGVVAIGASAFYGHSGVTSMNFPTTLKTIGSQAFDGTGFVNLEIPNSVETIGDWAFTNCKSLQSVRISASVTSITTPMHNCNKLVSIVVDENNPVYDSRNNCNAIIETATNKLITGCKTTVIPNNIKIIGTESFASNNETIVFPPSVTTIEEMAFWGNEFVSVELSENITSYGRNAFPSGSIKSVFSYRIRPVPIDESTFSEETYKNATLFVRTGTKSAYQRTEAWNHFATIEEFGDPVDVPEPIVVSLINNGDMEGEDNSNFFVRYDALGDQFKEVSKTTITNGVGVNGSRGVKVEAKAKVVEAWDNQFWFRLNQPVSAGTKVRLSFDYRADKEATISTESHAEPSTYIYYDPFGGDINVSKDWSHFEYEGTMDSNNSTDQLPFQSMTFTLNKYFEDANNYYFDNVEFKVILEDQCPKPTFKQMENSVIIQSPFDATIYYTIDGSKPTNRSYVYSAPLALSDDAIINAIAIVEGYETSPVATYSFKFTQDENLEEKKAELRKMIEQLSYEADYCRERLSEKDRDQTSNLWQMLNEILTEIAYAMKVLEDAKTEEDLIDCEKRIQIIAVELDRLRAEIEEYSPIHYSFDGLTAWVSGGVSLDEVFREVGGREVAAQTIAAIVWENSFALTANMLQGINNPNLLVYVNNASLAPQGVQNVVINGQAKEIVLVHATSGNNNWYCPQAFRAEKISYTRNFSQRTEIGKSRGWEGIALPFNVQAIMHESKGGLAPFGTGVGVKHFWLRAYDGENLYSAHEMEAYAPYIISMPNNDNYYADYNLNGRVTFSATNSEVYETPDFSFMENEPNMPLMTIPVFQRKAQSDSIYAINVGQARGSYAEGSVFERGLREVRPFEIYTVHHGQGARPRYVPISTQAQNDITGIKTIEIDEAEGTWYSLDGRQMQSQPQRKGVYLQKGKKVVIK